MALKITRKRKASTAKGRKAANATTRGNGPAQEPGRYEHVEIGELDVVLLQMNDLGRLDVQDVVFNVFDADADRRRAGAVWLAFHSPGMLHHAGKSTWLGLSKSVPLTTIDTIQAVLKAAGLEVERDMGRALHLDLNPFARLSDDGLEILVPAALVGDPAVRRVVGRGGAKPIARGYRIAPSKAAALNRLFFGPEE